MAFFGDWAQMFTSVTEILRAQVDRQAQVFTV